MVQDKIFFSAILASAPDDDVSVTMGGVALADARWTATPDGSSAAGRYHGSAAFDAAAGDTGEVVVTVLRGGVEVVQVVGREVSSECVGGEVGYENWNAWVGYDVSGVVVSGTPTSMDALVCVNGTSVTAFEGLCSFAW